MIGGLTVSMKDEDSGLKFYLGSCYKEGGGQDPIVGFNLADPEIAESISSNRSDIICILKDIAGVAHRLITEIPGLQHAIGLGWEYHKMGGTEHFDEYKAMLRRLAENPFVYEDDKESVTRQLQEIRQSETTAETKRVLVARRRSDFDKERDRLMLALIERDGCHCARCGSAENLTIDHVIPISKGGSDELSNLQLLCQSHNSAKGDRIATETEGSKGNE